MFNPSEDVGNRNSNGIGNNADDEADSDAEHEWWPQVAGRGSGDEVGIGADRTEDNAE